jgi:hypothetical protein
MPTSKKQLKIGDSVRVKGVDAFNLEWLKHTYTSTWSREKFTGTVSSKSGDKWNVDFTDGEKATLARGKIEFLERPVVERPVVQDELSDEEHGATAQPEAPAPDSSDDEEGNGGATQFFNEEPDHDSIPKKSGKKQDKIDISADWVRDDNFFDDQRPAEKTKHGPVLSGQPDASKTPLYLLVFQVGCMFLPATTFLQAMATKFTERGAAKYKEGAGDRSYARWNVTVDDILQYIGVWMYFLAFHQPGDRSQYWRETKFGPRHRLVEWLRLGGNGEKNEHWFDRMNECFELPTKPGTKPDDPFFKTRFFWECLRDSFFAAVTASWLIVLDESMVKWMGHGMPGLMVILRKPTPIGLELHTLCCALCGILIWFEIYEGKTAMALKEYNDEYPKSIALTLRMVEPFFGTGRVLVADSWFGSVACAAALYSMGIFCVMNVKTATKNFPKEQMMEVVDEIKGNSEDSKKRRRERRGAQIAFTQRVKIGETKEVTLLAAGHNKKVPLLLIATCMTMLKGKMHNKTWKVNEADGSVSQHEIKTPQPEVHALYRLWMNIIDLHNKLRQGVVSMADVWGTKDWAKRHFAEGLGFWEVNVYKAIIYFFPQYRGLSHGDFRARLAWALMTLGKVPYPSDEAEAGPGTSSSHTPHTGQGLPTAPLPGGTHEWVSTGHSPKKCTYCGKPCYSVCKTCNDIGLGLFSACGTLTGRPCKKDHVEGKPPKFGNWNMSSPGKRNCTAAMHKRRKGEGGHPVVDSDDFDYSDDDSDDDDMDGCPIGGGVRTSPRAKAARAKRRKEERERKQAKQAAAQAAAKAEEDAGRSARLAKRAMEAEA